MKMVIAALFLALAPTTVTEDVQDGGVVVSHPDEPFVYEVTETYAYADPAVETSVLVDVYDPATGETWTNDTVSSGPVRVEYPSRPGMIFDIVVIVNDHSEVSNLSGSVPYTPPTTTTTTTTTTSTTTTTQAPVRTTAPAPTCRSCVPFDASDVYWDPVWFVWQLPV